MIGRVQSLLLFYFFFFLFYIGRRVRNNGGYGLHAQKIERTRRVLHPSSVRVTTDTRQTGISLKPASS